MMKKGRAEKMYENGPKIVKGEDGKPRVSRGEKKAIVKNAGDEAEKVSAQPDTKMLDLMHQHSQERLELNHKHDMEVLKHTKSKAEEAMANETNQVRVTKDKETKPETKGE